MEVCPAIAEAIENSIAASRWRVAARLEKDRERAAQYARLARRRSEQASVLLAGVVAKSTMRRDAKRVTGGRG